MSKEQNILKLFFNEPTRQWHFEEILKEARLSRPQANSWLKKFLKQNLIIRIKPKKRMPYYLANYDDANYQTKKKLFALTQLENSGLLAHLTELQKKATIILFGSMARWDWHKESDIDLFVYGNAGGLRLGKYELKLGRDIQLFECKTKKDLSRFTDGLLKNIIKGNIIIGDIDFVKVTANK